jgi:hypothetical protein
MTGAPADLVGRWATLPRPAGERLSAERVRDWVGGPVLVAVDSRGRNHLLVGLHTSSVALPRPLRGLDVQLRLLQPPGQPESSWLDLTPTDDGDTRPFVGLAADVVAELPADGPPDPAALFGVIERWRRFFGRTNDGLSRGEQLGLVGELWLLLEWLPAVTVAAVDAWKGPLGGRHDWVSSAGLSVEVKTAGSSTGPVVHRVGRLDQLDEPPGSRLYLLSVRAIADASGQDSLDALLERARAAASAAGPTCATLLDDRLRALDLTQADVGAYSDPLRVAQAELFEVTADFPRLVPGSFPNGLPAGVTDLAYSLDLSACDPWLLARRPADTQVLAALTK